LAQNPELPFEMPASVAKQQVQPDQPTVCRRQVPILHLRNQAARVLA
jgi:hypothetical protein